MTNLAHALAPATARQLYVFHPTTRRDKRRRLIGAEIQKRLVAKGIKKVTSLLEDPEVRPKTVKELARLLKRLSDELHD